MIQFPCRNSYGGENAAANEKLPPTPLPRSSSAAAREETCAGLGQVSPGPRFRKPNNGRWSPPGKNRTPPGRVGCGRTAGGGKKKGLAGSGGRAHVRRVSPEREATFLMEPEDGRFYCTVWGRGGDYFHPFERGGSV